MALRAERAIGAARLPSPTEAEPEPIDIFDAARTLAELDPRGGAVPHALTSREFLDSLGVALYTTDADGRITFFNEAAARFWGRRPAMGELWCGSLRLYHPDGRRMRHDECPMAIALKENRTTHGGEATAERPDGSRVGFIAYPTPLHDSEARLIGAVNVLVDVTARRRAEDELRETTRALRGSNAVRDEFLGLVSHELRTPVTTIFGNAQLLRDRADALADDDRRSMVADIAEDSGRLLGIIENLLLLTRLGSGTTPELEPQVLDRIVRRSVREFERHFDRPVGLTIGPGVPIVEADRTAIELVVANLLGNAAKYSPAGSPIDVEVTTEDDETRVTVRDRGIGLEGADPSVLFSPFYRGDVARRKANGIGVGLAVCLRVIESHGGRIWAEPRRGGGAEFGFSLPLAEDAVEVA